VKVKPWTLGQPSLNELGLVGLVIVEDEVDFKIVRYGLIDGVEELAELHRGFPDRGRGG
jgi:hypothetical protein